MPPARQVGWGRVWNRWVFSGWVRQAGLGEMWYFRWGMVGCGLTRQVGSGLELFGALGFVMVRFGKAV